MCVQEHDLIRGRAGARARSPAAEHGPDWETRLLTVGNSASSCSFPFTVKGRECGPTIKIFVYRIPVLSPDSAERKFKSYSSRSW